MDPVTIGLVALASWSWLSNPSLPKNAPAWVKRIWGTLCSAAASLGVPRGFLIGWFQVESSGDASSSGGYWSKGIWHSELGLSQISDEEYRELGFPVVEASRLRDPKFSAYWGARHAAYYAHVVASWGLNLTADAFWRFVKLCHSIGARRAKAAALAAEGDWSKLEQQHPKWWGQGPDAHLSHIDELMTYGAQFGPVT